jgi:hypothetical protein
MNGAHFSCENITVTMQSKTVRVPVIQKFPNPTKPVFTQESRSNYRKQLFIDAPQTHLHTVVYVGHKCKIPQVQVELRNKVRPRYNLTLTDNRSFGKTV